MRGLLPTRLVHTRKSPAGVWIGIIRTPPDQASLRPALSNHEGGDDDVSAAAAANAKTDSNKATRTWRMAGLPSGTCAYSTPGAGAAVRASSCASNRYSGSMSSAGSRTSGPQASALQPKYRVCPSCDQVAVAPPPIVKSQATPSLRSLPEIEHGSW